MSIDDRLDRCVDEWGYHSECGGIADPTHLIDVPLRPVDGYDPVDHGEFDSFDPIGAVLQSIVGDHLFHIGKIESAPNIAFGQ